VPIFEFRETINKSPLGEAASIFEQMVRALRSRKPLKGETSKSHSKHSNGYRGLICDN